ncbi:gamma-butyrobetaine hydroxylase-like domain-containing protein [Candidatus Phycosocius spiralis]|uniref:Gamma-butyrobetaine hydroxylase-like N-terminal domain-containing protein n=1 Tax=Candidatus Phycosocius spiralis TaxID=2815099 RepID=A0ABQ4PY67_9PROT|nr:gamma-butyrobetaine hydroxylase-like domain-containing protein [Candidatus Phycosocius spiralis]GIU68024.1 hypothetical protein PsB1_2178 [Candidatus Phycosocius spiralis]
MPNEVASSRERPWPTELIFQAKKKQLIIAFDDASTFLIPYELLRVESPSAEVQGHHGVEKKWVHDKADVTVLRAEPVGRYALRLIFDDGHNSGIFTWDWLYRLGKDQKTLMQRYRQACQTR